MNKGPNLREWLAAHGLEKYAELLSENAVDLDVLAQITEGDLKDLGIPLGDLLKRFKPTSKAKYVSFETVVRPEEMPGTAPQPCPMAYSFHSWLSSSSSSMTSGSSVSLMRGSRSTRRARHSPSRCARPSPRRSGRPADA